MERPAPKKFRRDTGILYVGSESDSLPSAKLPTVRQVLCFYFKLNRDSKVLDKRSASRDAIRSVYSVWNKTKIPVIQEVKAIEKLEGLYKEWRQITRHPNRKSATELSKIQKFTNKLDSLFDVSKSDAQSFLERCVKQAQTPADKKAWEEELEFYIDQKGLRVFSMGSVDKKMAEKERKQAEKRARKEERRQKEEERRQKDIDNSSSMTENRRVSDEIMNVLGSDSDSSDGESPSRNRRGRRDIITPEVVEALDAAKIGSGTAANILAAATKALGVNVAETNINRSTINKKRENLRAESVTRQKQELNESADRVLTVHWDGKKVPPLSANSIVAADVKSAEERHTVVVTGITTDQCLGAPVLPDGCATTISEAVFQLLVEWKLVANVKAAGFDTVGTNTGWSGGAAVLLERKLGKLLLWLPCRHHVFERVLEATFRELMGPSSGPNDKLFENFRKETWPTIDQTKFSTFKDLAITRRHLSECADEMIIFAKSQIKERQPRGDYQEFLELVIIFLGGVPERGVKFQHPGPTNSARWMSVALYTLKIAMFRRQVKLPKSQMDAILQLAIFVIRVYFHAWFTAPLALSAPRNDLNLLKTLINYEKVNKRVALAASNRFSNHLWYLSEFMLGITIFDEELSDTERQNIVNNMFNQDGDDDPPRKREIQLRNVPEMTLSSLVTRNALKFFEILELEVGFLQCPVEQWKSREDYISTRKIVSHLKVVNDVAERGVKLFKDFNRSVTKKEDSFQNLVVSVHSLRKSKPDNKKETLIQKYDNKNDN